MKKLLMTLILSGLTTQAFAGILLNRSTKESIEFDLNIEAREVNISSTATNVVNQRINLKSIQRDQSDIRIYGITEDACDGMSMTLNECLLVPGLFIPGLVVGTMETLMLPFKGSAKLIQTMKRKKDFKVLMQAINTAKTIKVGTKRFRRVEKLINNQN